MNSSHFIITGTSRGIGKQLAKMLLDRGNYVFGISREDSNELTHYKKYTQYIFDLFNVMGIETLLKSILFQIEVKNSELICLINNAAMLEPLRPIDQCNAEEINRSIQINLVAPMVISSCFINITGNFPIRRKLINISSGSGVYSAPGMSVYCTTKAGINMFTECVGAEQSKSANPIEVIAVDPGMVETGMQELAREKNSQDFEMAKFFREAYDTGQLRSTETLGGHILRLIDKKFEPGKLVKFSEG